MRDWRFWDWAGFSALWLVVVVEAFGEASKQLPDMSASWPLFYAGWWSYVPLALLTFATVVLSWRASRGHGAPAEAPTLPSIDDIAAPGTALRQVLDRPPEVTATITSNAELLRKHMPPDRQAQPADVPFEPQRRALDVKQHHSIPRTPGPAPAEPLHIIYTDAADCYEYAREFVRAFNNSISWKVAPLSIEPEPDRIPRGGLIIRVANRNALTVAEEALEKALSRARLDYEIREGRQLEGRKGAELVVTRHPDAPDRV